MGTILCCEVTEIGFGSLDSCLSIVGHTCLAQTSMKGLEQTFSAPSCGEKDKISNLTSLFPALIGDIGILVSSVTFRPVLMPFENHFFEHLQTEGPVLTQLTS